MRMGTGFLCFLRLHGFPSRPIVYMYILPSLQGLLTAFLTTLRLGFLLSFFAPHLTPTIPSPHPDRRHHHSHSYPSFTLALAHSCYLSLSSLYFSLRSAEQRAAPSQPASDLFHQDPPPVKQLLSTRPDSFCCSSDILLFLFAKPLLPLIC